MYNCQAFLFFFFDKIYEISKQIFIKIIWNATFEWHSNPETFVWRRRKDCNDKMTTASTITVMLLQLLPSMRFRHVTTWPLPFPFDSVPLKSSFYFFPSSPSGKLFYFQATIHLQRSLLAQVFIVLFHNPYLLASLFASPFAPLGPNKQVKQVMLG